MSLKTAGRQVPRAARVPPACPTCKCRRWKVVFVLGVGDHHWLQGRLCCSFHGARLAPSRLTGFEKRRYVCRVLRSLIQSLSCAHGCCRLGGNSEIYPQRVYCCRSYLSANVGPFIEADPVIRSVLRSLSDGPPPPFWPRRENPGDRSAALPSWDVRQKGEEERG